MNCIDSVNGRTRIFGIIGNPIEHSFSPILQNTIAKEMGHNHIYVPFCVEKGKVGVAIEGAYRLGIEGFNVTVPHKMEVINSLYEIDTLAEQIGAVNTLKKTDKGYKGYNTDILGLDMCFKTRNIQIEGKTVVILGSGGAAHSAVILAANRGANEIYVVNRTIENAVKITNIVKKYYDTPVFAVGYDKLNDLHKADIVIQTTSVGMGESADNSPVKDCSFLNNTEAVVDIIYTPWETKFIKDSKKAGCIACNGFDMLIFQGIASYEIWNDIKIDNTTANNIKERLTEYYMGNG